MTLNRKWGSVWTFVLAMPYTARTTLSSEVYVTGDEDFCGSGHTMIQVNKNVGEPSAASTDALEGRGSDAGSSVGNSMSSSSFFGSLGAAYHGVVHVIERLWGAKTELPKSSSRIIMPVTYGAPVGQGGQLAAVVETQVCSKDFYWPSKLELDFSNNVHSWTTNSFDLCAHLKSNNWVRENLVGTGTASPTFSRLCRKGQLMEVIEPLAGILRDPNFLCNMSSKFSVDWLVLADVRKEPLATHAKRYFFDAGGSVFRDGLTFFLRNYAQRGIVFDHVYVWEARLQGKEAYWSGVPKQVRDFWEPRLTFYDGTPITSDPANAEHNPVSRIYRTCKEEDFCAFKLDIDTPTVEMSIVHQLLDNPGETRRSLNEFYFEHHVKGLMQKQGWGTNVNGTFADSYKLFTQLRHMGVRAHSWI